MICKGREPNLKTDQLDSAVGIVAVFDPFSALWLKWCVRSGLTGVVHCVIPMRWQRESPNQGRGYQAHRPRDDSS